MYIKRLDQTFDFPAKHTWMMGILNVTPDSFSDGGLYDNPEGAAAQVQKMLAEGVDIIDIGGESTRLGYTPTTLEEELERVIPAVKAVRAVSDVIISIDTSKAEVARQAILAGADIINDQWMAMKEPEIASVCAEYNVPLLLMHNRWEYTPYQAVGKEIAQDLESQVDFCVQAGLAREQILIDPGVGFVKTADDNLLAVKELSELQRLGLPIVLATSRKSFLGKLLPDSQANERDVATSATTVYGIMHGADMVRVHNVKVNKEAAVVADAIKRGRIDAE